MSMSDHDQEKLARRADIVRARLAREVEAVDEKLHHSIDRRALLAKAKAPLRRAAFVAAGVAVVAFGISAVRAHRRRQRMFTERARAVRRAFLHPERVAVAQSGLFGALARRVLAAAVSYAAMELGKRMVRGELPVGRA